MRLIDADALKGEKFYSYERHENCVSVYAIDMMPTIEPDRPHGEWDEVFIDTIEGTIDCACSECGYPIIDYSVDLKLPNFCPNCGADMREGEAE